MKIKRKRLKTNRSITVIGIVSFLILGIYTITLFFPLIWALINSLKAKFDFLDNNYLYGLPRALMENDPTGLRSGWHFDNYIKAFQLMYIQITVTGAPPRNIYAPQMMLNSLLYALGCTFMATASHFVTAYACAKYKFKLGKIIYTIVIVTMILPIVGALPSEIQMARSLGFYDNYFGVLIMKGGFLGMNFLIFYASFKTIPDSFAEAAKIDGAGHWRIMLLIILPLSIRTVSAIALILFIGFWNEYYTPMIYLPSMPTIAYGLYRFQFAVDNSVSVPIQLAGGFIVCVPILIIFVIFRNKIIGNISMGGLKG